MTGKAFLIALVLTPIIRDIFRSYNIVDRPAQRKVHAYPIPRVGGIPIAIAYAVALLTMGSSNSVWNAAGPAARNLIPGAALVFLLGLVDDFFNLKPLQKIAGMVAAACIVFYGGVRISSIAGQALPGWIAFPVTIFWLLLTSNALNLIDGLDGLCAGMGMFATLTLFVAAVLHGNYPLALATLPLAGALLGFLVYNLNPATVFLGDSGALLIGFLLGCYGIIWTQKTSTLLSVAVPLLALSIPLLDVSLSIVRRFLRNQPIFAADRGHIHHRLLDRGLSVRQAVWVLYLFATLAAGFAIIATSARDSKYQTAAIGAFILAVLFGIRQLRYTEFDIAGRLFFRGEFYRSVDSKMRLTAVEAALGKAANEAAWWAALVDGGSRIGLVSIEWTGAAGRRHHSFIPAGGELWAFEVAVSEGECIRIEGRLDAASAAVDLLGLGAILRRTFPLVNRAAVPVKTAERAAVASS